MIKRELLQLPEQPKVVKLSFLFFSFVMGKLYA